MKNFAASLVGGGMIAALVASPAYAGVVPVPEPEVFGGLVALGLLGAGYRVLRSRISR